MKAFEIPIYVRQKGGWEKVAPIIITGEKKAKAIQMALLSASKKNSGTAIGIDAEEIREFELITL